MNASKSIPIILILWLTVMVGLTTGFAVAANLPNAPPQPFSHPANDISYDQDYTDDGSLSHETQVNGGVQFITGGIADGGMPLPIAKIILF